MRDFEADYSDMAEPAYILFEDGGSGEFAFGCCTGHIWEASNIEATSIDFSSSGSDEMDEVNDDGSAAAKSATTTALNLPSSPKSGLFQ